MSLNHQSSRWSFTNAVNCHQTTYRTSDIIFVVYLLAKDSSHKFWERGTSTSSFQDDWWFCLSFEFQCTCKAVVCFEPRNWWVALLHCSSEMFWADLVVQVPVPYHFAFVLWTRTLDQCSHPLVQHQVSLFLLGYLFMPLMCCH